MMESLSTLLWFRFLHRLESETRKGFYLQKSTTCNQGIYMLYYLYITVKSVVRTTNTRINLLTLTYLFGCYIKSNEMCGSAIMICLKKTLLYIYIYIYTNTIPNDKTITNNKKKQTITKSKHDYNIFTSKPNMVAYVKQFKHRKPKQVSLTVWNSTCEGFSINNCHISEPVFISAQLILLREEENA